MVMKSGERFPLVVRGGLVRAFGSLATSSS